MNEEIPPKSKDELLSYIAENDIQFIELQFSDLLGTVKSVSIPVGNAEKALNEGVYIDGSSVIGYSTVEESDMRAMPILDSFQTYPWTERGNMKTARLMCTISDVSRGGSDGRFCGDPRYILERQLEKAAEMGLNYNTGPEMEFFLFRTGEDGEPLLTSSDSGGYFDLIPMDQGERVRKEIMLTFDRMGFRVESSHHEVAPGQQELALRYGNALTIADRMITMKLGIRTIAKQNGMHATFMPKPLSNEYGSAMHVHQSLTDADGNNVFYDPDGEFELSDTALRFIGGLLKHARETCAILTSHINSYRRLVPGFEAPHCITWANRNRSALVRVPAGRGSSTRVEHRNPDPAGNPYLQFAVMLAAGLDGIENDIYPGEPFEKDTFKMGRDSIRSNGIETLPEDLGQALELMRGSELLERTLGTHIFDSFLHIKGEEWNRFRNHVTSFELDRYISVV